MFDQGKHRPWLFVCVDALSGLFVLARRRRQLLWLLPLLPQCFSSPRSRRNGVLTLSAWRPPTP